MGKVRSFDESFWPLVDKSGECWEWRGAKRGGRKNQYGNWRGRMAHRVSWEVANGSQVPDGMMVCHRCDNPVCVKPDHLFVGTAKDNAADCFRKMRSPVAKLSWDQVAQIRRLYATGGILQREIARQFHVTQSTISAIVLGSRWNA